MVLKRIAVCPCAAGLIEPGRALGQPTLHFQYMSDRVYAPQIFRVHLDTASACLFCFYILATFFKSERQHAKRISVARKVGVEAAQGQRWHVVKGTAFPSPEVGEMIEPQGQKVPRTFGNDLLPNTGGAPRVAFAPGRERPNVHLLSYRSQLCIGTRL